MQYLELLQSRETVEQSRWKEQKKTKFQFHPLGESVYIYPSSQ